MAANFEQWKLALVSKHFKVESANIKNELSPDDNIAHSEISSEKNCVIFEEDVINDSSSSDDGKVVSSNVNTVQYSLEVTDRVEPDDHKIVFKDLLSNSEVETDKLLGETEELSGDEFCDKNDKMGEDVCISDDTVKNKQLAEIESITISEDFDFSRDNLASDVSSEHLSNQDVRLRQDKKVMRGIDESSSKKGASVGINCVSFILIWGKEEFHKKLGGRRGEGKVLIQNLVKSVCKCLGSLEADLKFECQSTEGNQVRKDFVFNNGEQAKEFVEKVKATVQSPKNVVLKPFLSSEKYFGLELEPVLTEQDLLLLAKDMQAVHLFRHFLDCRILSDGDDVTFRFNSLSDINLFLFNKAQPCKRSLGSLKSWPRQLLKLEADEDGILTLETKDLRLGSKNKDWTDLESRFMFKTRVKKGIKYLLFKNKKDLFYFYVSREAKELTSLLITHTQIMGMKPQKIEPLVTGTKERKFASRLVDKQKELKNVKENVLKREKEIKAQRRIIQRLTQKLNSVPDCIPNTLRLKDVLRLKFREENESSSNYPLCLRTFLQSDDLLKVAAELGGEIIFTFSTSSKLEKLLMSQCCKTVKKWSDIPNLPQRAGLIRDKLYKDFGLLVYIEETSLLVKTIKQVEDELLVCQAKVEYRNFGFAARFPTVLSLMQALVNRELYSNHRVMFMQENVLFMGRSGCDQFFKGEVCLTEEDWLRLQWKKREENSCSLDGKTSIESYVVGLSIFLQDCKVKKVCEDWEGKIVMCFESQQILESLLIDHCQYISNTVTKVGRLPVNICYTGSGHCYSVGCPPDVDVRHFFMIDNSCYILQDPFQISSASRIFPFLCLNDAELRTAYPSVCLQASNFAEL